MRIQSLFTHRHADGRYGVLESMKEQENKAVGCLAGFEFIIFSKESCCNQILQASPINTSSFYVPALYLRIVSTVCNPNISTQNISDNHYHIKQQQYSPWHCAHGQLSSHKMYLAVKAHKMVQFLTTTTRCRQIPSLLPQTRFLSKLITALLRLTVQKWTRETEIYNSK